MKPRPAADRPALEPVWRPDRWDAIGFAAAAIVILALALSGVWS